MRRVVSDRFRTLDRYFTLSEHVNGVLTDEFRRLPIVDNLKPPRRCEIFWQFLQPPGNTSFDLIHRRKHCRLGAKIALRTQGGIAIELSFNPVVITYTGGKVAILQVIHPSCLLMLIYHLSSLTQGTPEIFQPERSERN